MTPDQQEARSIRYSAGVWLVPLESGLWAVFSARGLESEEVIGAWGDLEAIVQEVASRQVEARRLRDERQAATRSAGPRRITATLEELGL